MRAVGVTRAVGAAGAGQLALRAPRVAVLFRADDRWQDWARLALAELSRIWGGLGFVLVPYDPVTASVDPVVLQLVVAYDPDHVVTLAPAVPDWLALAPDHIDPAGASVDELADHTFPDRAGEAARDVVAAACSPLRNPVRAGEGVSRGTESIRHLRPGDRAGSLLRAPGKAAERTCLAVDPDWRGPDALWAAVRCGISAPAKYKRRRPPKLALFGWAVAPHFLLPPEELLRYPQMELAGRVEGRGTWFADTDPALRQFALNVMPETSVWVFGDTATDFAAAMLYDRILGSGTWIPTEYDVAAEPAALAALDLHLQSIKSGGGPAYATSVTLTDDELQARVVRVQRADVFPGDSAARGDDPNPRQNVLTITRPSLRRAHRSYYLEDRLGDRISLPVTIDDDGWLIYQTGIVSPLPQPETLAFPQHSPAFPYWYVDVTLDEDPIPKGRDLPAAAVQVLAPVFSEAIVRRSRNGYTFPAANLGFVPAEATLSGRLARAQLVVPTLTGWLVAMAEAADMHVRISHPGQMAQLLADRLGGRARLADLLLAAGPLLRPFIPRDRPDKRPRLPSTDGDTINKTDDVLTLTGLNRAAPNLDLGAVREIIDTLVAAELLWPGFTLRCQDCRTVSHLRLDQLGNTFHCPRCNARNPLTHDRWSSTGDPADPVLYYDLHPVFRRLLHDHGDVPLLAATALRGTGSYADVPEMEFTPHEAESPAFEIDLIAQIDDRLVIVEAKSTDTFGSRRSAQIRKLVDAARLLRADQVVLATTAPGGWNSSDVTALRAEASCRPNQRQLAVDVLILAARRPAES